MYLVGVRACLPACLRQQANRERSERLNVNQDKH